MVAQALQVLDGELVLVEGRMRAICRVGHEGGLVVVAIQRSKQRQRRDVNTNGRSSMSGFIDETV